MTWFFIFFFISGFCSILYELIWLRLAMAQFGVTTALTSSVLSVFMAGLGVGSLGAGFLARHHAQRLGKRSLRFYAICELVIGVSALTVPLELSYGHQLLATLAGRSDLSSAADYVICGILLTVTLLPWCGFMGATIPLAMFAIRTNCRHESRHSFSFLYVANVLGAVGGAVISPLLIELLGFHVTLRVGAVFNALIAICALMLSLAALKHTTTSATSEAPATGIARVVSDRRLLLLLFLTGLTSMGMELVWIRLFTPYIGPVVYSFAGILACYLIATFLGSRLYRLWKSAKLDTELAWIALVPAGLLTLLAADTRLAIPLFSTAPARVILGVAPYASLLGFLTPLLVDRWSAGDPDRAGRAYAINVFGCILGPLLAGFVLLPLVGERGTAVILSLPWVTMLFSGSYFHQARLRQAYGYGAVALGVAILFFTRDYMNQYSEGRVLRDSTATVVAAGTGKDKVLLVNGIGMTKMRPVTKMMAHLTLASLDHAPRKALIICFGMGTTFRSAMSWGVPTTVVDLVPSVPRLFTYFHPNSGNIFNSPHAQIIVDDGRRFLERTHEEFDVIIIDPPPPVEAAGSSMLYSEEFYALTKQHLQPDGILEQWLPTGDEAVKSSVTLALQNSFPHLRILHNDLTGMHGWHFFASLEPIPVRSADEIVARMPASAICDMMEWGPETSPVQQVERDLSNEVSPADMIALSPATSPLEDDKPVNEYYLVRQTLQRFQKSRNPTVSAVRNLFAKR